VSRDSATGMEVGRKEGKQVCRAVRSLVVWCNEQEAARRARSVASEEDGDTQSCSTLALRQ